jgi:hypothetical protein
MSNPIKSDSPDGAVVLPRFVRLRFWWAFSGRRDTIHHALTVTSILACLAIGEYLFGHWDDARKPEASPATSPESVVKMGCGSIHPCGCRPRSESSSRQLSP